MQKEEQQIEVEEEDIEEAEQDNLDDRSPVKGGGGSADTGARGNRVQACPTGQTLTGRHVGAVTDCSITCQSEQYALVRK